jgi:DNA topoisomerase-1
MNLLIVESPAKAKTIEKYLGRDYKVLASFGHIRDLPTSKIGVDVDKNFEPTYVIPAKAKKVLKDLKEAIAKADTIYLATDYDREGEAIAWHIVQATELKNKKSKAQNVKRITFTEITKSALVEAVANPREIDLNLVDAQQARRILDRLVGYKLSPFLWAKVARGLSAGRVQSVALRMIVEREREIEKFEKVEYWSVEAILSSHQVSFKAILVEVDGAKIDKMAIKNDPEAQEILANLENETYVVASLNSKDKKRSPAPPFTTSTLQQDAGSKLGFSSKQTMRLAQTLYEQGLITYMRTDSVQISSQAATAAAQTLKNEFGPKYALSTPRFFKSKSKGAQEAHEAIRPTDPALRPEGANLERQSERLYCLIWQRFLASQMPEAQLLETQVKIQAGKCVFNASGSEIKFDGFLKVYNIEDDDRSSQKLPPLSVGEKLDLEKLEKLQHFTEPPARFSEGTLVKELEKQGIGRPSTYAPTISTIQDRGYVEKLEGRLVPQEIGIRVNDILVEHFPEIVDFSFTAQVEEKFDKIAEGEIEWQPVIKAFYDPFAQHLAEKTASVVKENLDEETDEICPTCGAPVVIKHGRFGKFYACSKYPDCKYTKPFLDAKTQAEAEKASDEKCPKCGKPMVLKQSKFGAFLACSGYPECKQTKSLAPAAEVPCPNCGKKLLKRRSKRGRMFWGCEGYPECKTAFWNEPTTEKCPTCNGLMTKTAKGELICPECKK